jgi:L-iditol 2-dehydrogenase
LQTVDSSLAQTASPLDGTMRAAVYRGSSTISVEPVDVPAIGPGEILVRVEACGICHTDLKKVEYNLLPPPRVFGHETAGVVAAVGEGVTRFQPGDGVIAFHHIPCRNCFYCEHKLYAQCQGYKRVGITAGYGEPAGGGFAQYVRVMDWIVRDGVEKIPPGVPFDRASFVEPLNTCLKAVVQVDPQPNETVAILGQGPIGLMFTMLVKRTGGRIFATDTFSSRRQLAIRAGAEEAFDPRDNSFEQRIRAASSGRGADLVIVAASARGIVEQAMRISRPGSRILLFAQTSHQERVEVSGADICMGERTLCGAYSASVDLQRQSAELVFGGEVPVDLLISHRVPLDEIRSGIDLALHPNEQSLKIVVLPQRSK